MEEHKKINLVNHWKENNIITDERLLNTFQEVKRENFVLPELKQYAYEDTPLPIIKGQTISQPTTVMLMTQALELKKGEKVLEVGAGSGYQAAIIARMIGSKGKVVTTEIIPELAELARKNLEKEGIKNVEIIEWDGSKGCSKNAPYDKIIVTAATPKIPSALIEQLRENGIIVIPTGQMYSQEMIVGVKKKGNLETKSLGYFQFVPMKGEFGFK